jgi:hypothetical protein
MTYIIRDYEEYDRPTRTSVNAHGETKDVCIRSIVICDKEIKNKIKKGNYVILDQAGWWKVLDVIRKPDMTVCYVSDDWDYFIVKNEKIYK